MNLIKLAFTRVAADATCLPLTARVNTHDWVSRAGQTKTDAAVDVGRNVGAASDSEIIWTKDNAGWEIDIYSRSQKQG